MFQIIWIIYIYTSRLCITLIVIGINLINIKSHRHREKTLLSLCPELYHTSNK